MPILLSCVSRLSFVAGLFSFLYFALSFLSCAVLFCPVSLLLPVPILLCCCPTVLLSFAAALALLCAALWLFSALLRLPSFFVIVIILVSNLNLFSNLFLRDWLRIKNHFDAHFEPRGGSWTCRRACDVRSHARAVR